MILFTIMQLTVMSAILGILAGIGTALIRKAHFRKIAAFAIILLLVVVCCGLELGQLLEPSRSGAGLVPDPFSRANPKIKV